MVSRFGVEVSRPGLSLPPGVRPALSGAGSPLKAFGGGCACCPASADASPACDLCHDDGADKTAEEAAAADGGPAEGAWPTLEDSNALS